MPTYAITANTTEVNEGTVVTFTVETGEVEDGTTLYWTVAGTNITTGDFVVASLSGSVTISGSAASFLVTVRNDSALEWYEYFVVQLRTDSTSGTVVAVSQNITITDTSTGTIINDPENGNVGCAADDGYKPAYYANGSWYKITGTAIPL